MSAQRRTNNVVYTLSHIVCASSAELSRTHFFLCERSRGDQSLELRNRLRALGIEQNCLWALSKVNQLPGGRHSAHGVSDGGNSRHMFQVRSRTRFNEGLWLCHTNICHDNAGKLHEQREFLSCSAMLFLLLRCFLTTGWKRTAGAVHQVM